MENQHVIITGGTRGIGRGIAQAFLKKGACVIATYSGNENAAKSFLEENAQYEGKVHAYKFDLADPNAVTDFFRYYDDKFPSLEVLINNGGIRRDSIGASMSALDWQRVIDVNLSGTFYMSKEAILRFMSKRYGRIVNISSIGGELGLPGQANYAASKAGQVAMAKSLAKEVAKRGITVNCVLPGFIDTELIEDLPAEQVNEYKKQVPMKRFGTVEEVASAVCFLSSKEASYITGACLEITGGL